MKFLKQHIRRRKTEKGNIFFMLFAAVGVVGALGVGSTTILKGPVSSMVKTNQVTMIESRAELDLKLMVNNIITTTPDCDLDGTMEAMAWRDATVGEPPVITGGGYLPTAIAGATTDPWGRELGYCVWDNGSAIDDVGCGGATQDRLTGSTSTTEPFVAVVSAGPDQKFQTSCVDFVDVAPADGAPDTPLIARVANSDDIVMSYTYDELKTVMGDNWLFTSDTVGEDTVKTAQGVEIANDVTIPTGILDMNLLGGTLSLSDVSGAVCNVANEGQMFRDASVTPPAIMLCDSGTFVSIGGGGASSGDCAGKNTGICIGFDPEGANCEVNNGGPFVELDTDVPGGVMRDVWTDGTYIYMNGQTVTYAYSFDGTSLTQIAQFSSGFASNGLIGDGNYIYVGQGVVQGVRALTFDGTSFSSVASMGLTGTTQGVAVDDNYIYVVSGAAGVRALTFDGTAFTLLDSFGTPGTARNIWTDNNYVYVADDAGGVHAFTFDGTSFALIDTYDTSGNAYGVWGDGSFIYVADGADGVHAFTFNGTSFTLVDTFNTSDSAGDVWGDGTYIYVADENTTGLYALTFDGTSFAQADLISTNSYAYGVHGDGTYLYVADGNGGLAAFSGFECTSISAKPEIDTKTDPNVKIYGWGDNEYGQFVDDVYGTTDQVSPVEITELNDIRDISISVTGHACGIDSNDQIWCWGAPGNFKLGHNNFTGNQPPQKIIGENSNFKSVSVGNQHTCALKYDGTAWCWGSDGVGQLGDGASGGNRALPTQVVDITDFVFLRAGRDMTCGVRQNGEVWCWGSDDNGGLGNGSILIEDLSRPSKVKNISNAVQVGFAGFDTGCALTSKGTVWCWGEDDNGQLGDGAGDINQDEPVQVEDLENVIQIASNIFGGHGCALKDDGTAWCWGQNDVAQLGNGTTGGDADVPSQVSTITDFVKIELGGLQHGCGLRANGEIWCWGADSDGALGNGATSGIQNIPVQIDSTLKFYDLALGRNTVIALTKDYTDGDESLPVAPVMIQQSHDAGEAVGSHGLAVTYNGPSGALAGIALTVDADLDSGDPTSVNINTRKGGSENELRFTTNSTDILRLKKDNFTIGNENGVIGTRVGQLQIGVHDGAWSSDLSYIDGLLISKKGVATLNPSYFGVNSETGETTILSGRELLIQHTDDTGVTIAPVASFLNNTGSTFFGAVNVRGGDFTITAYTDTATEYAAYQFFRYRGDATTPAIAGVNDVFGRIRFRGHGTSNYTGPAKIESILTAGSGAGNMRANLKLSTGNSGSDGGVSNEFDIRYTGKVVFDNSATVNPNSLLIIGGRGAADEGVKFSNDTTCASAANDEGTIRWTGTTYEYCDGTQWLPMIPTADDSSCTDDEIFYDIATGFGQSCALYSNGQAVCWGRNDSDWLGNASPNTTELDLIPISRHVIDDAVKISTGWGGSCALTKQGEIKCWGLNTQGGLGNGTTDDINYPTSIASTEKFIDVDINGLHSCGVTDANKVMCWGQNANGELGDGSTTNSLIPIEVYGISNAVKISTGYIQSCAVLSDKTVKCWGNNDNGELGRGTATAYEPLPAIVSGLTDVIDIGINGRIAPDNHTACAVKTDGTVWCWGNNIQGQLGQGSTGSDQLTPIQVSGITNAINIAMGGRTPCILRSDGTVSCWGEDGEGQLGNGAPFSNSSSPVNVTGITTAVKLTAGRENICAILHDGSSQCWGDNGNGGLGDGTTTNSPAPVDVINPLSCNSDKYVFLTSISYPADLGGLKGADALCQSHADQVRLPGTYKAWLSDDTNSPSTRFNRLDSAYDYKLVNGTVVADGWDDLTDGTIDTPIIVTEKNVTLTNDVVPTNTATDGTALNATENCINWTSSASTLNYNRGRFSVSDSRWTVEGSTSSCDTTHKLYCFQQ